MTDTTKAPLAANIPQHIPGHWYWADLQTTDLTAATALYTELFGWETADLVRPGGTYRMAGRGGQRMVGLAQLGPDQRAAGVEPHWLCYVSTANIEASTARVRELDGTVLAGPFMVADAGLMTVAQDPTGALFALWQTVSNPGTSVTAVHGSLAWFELQSTDVAASVACYCDLLKLTVESNDMGRGMIYHVLSSGIGGQSCGVMQQMPDQDGAPSTWGASIFVDDVDTSHARALALGAHQRMSPHDIAGVGRASVIMDAQGVVTRLFTGVR